jgi:hypothetical protein
MLLNYLLFLLFALYMMFSFSVIFNVLKQVKKGNKDQQEIKTRLHWLRENLNDIKRHLKVGR